MPYQVLVHYLIDPEPPYDVSAFAAFTVNLTWVRNEYFLPVLQQAATIGGNVDVLSFAVTDDQGSVVASTGPTRTDSKDVQRAFALLFIDRVLLSPAPEGAVHEWRVHVRSSSDSALSSALGGARRTFTLIVLSALVTIGGLFVTIRAVEARAALAIMKSDFVSAVTHDLKTPVALIRLVGDTLASGRYASPNAIADYARLLSQEATRLSQSIDKLLTYARYSDAQKRARLELSPHDASELIEQGVESLRPALAAAGFTVTLDLPRDLPHVMTDSRAIGQVVENIVDNSIKYAGDVAALDVSARANGRFVRVIFADKGIGIPQDDLQYVFDRFYRARNARAAGSGLGLAIAKRILEYHGGHISVRSTVGVGTEVELLLPTGTS